MSEAEPTTVPVTEAEQPQEQNSPTLTPSDQQTTSEGAQSTETNATASQVAALSQEEVEVTSASLGAPTTESVTQVTDSSEQQVPAANNTSGSANVTDGASQGSPAEEAAQKKNEEVVSSSDPTEPVTQPTEPAVEATKSTVTDKTPEEPVKVESKSESQPSAVPVQQKAPETTAATTKAEEPKKEEPKKEEPKKEEPKKDAFAPSSTFSTHKPVTSSTFSTHNPVTSSTFSTHNPVTASTPVPAKPLTPSSSSTVAAAPAKVLAPSPSPSPASSVSSTSRPVSTNLQQRASAWQNTALQTPTRNDFATNSNASSRYVSPSASQRGSVFSYSQTGPLNATQTGTNTYDKRSAGSSQGSLANLLGTSLNKSHSGAFTGLTRNRVDADEERARMEHRNRGVNTAMQQQMKTAINEANEVRSGHRQSTVGSVNYLANKLDKAQAPSVPVTGTSAFSKAKLTEDNAQADALKTSAQ